MRRKIGSCRRKVPRLSGAFVAAFVEWRNHSHRDVEHSRELSGFAGSGRVDRLQASARRVDASRLSGSATIPNTVFQIIVNLIDFKMSMRDAIEFPRIHHQYRPDRIDAKPAALADDVAVKMRSFGHTINARLRSQGDIHAVGIAEDGWRIGWSDGRRGGRVHGY